MTVSTFLRGKPFWAELTRLDEGMDIGVYGGDSTHVGAVTIAEKGELLQTIQCRGHRDAVISELWAGYFHKLTGQTVTVRCGIHFDHFVKEDLTDIMAANQRLIAMAERMIV